MLVEGDKRELSSEGARRATGEEGSGESKKPRRFSAGMKAQVVLRLLRGEDIEGLSRELNVSAARISEWRDKFLSAGEEAMKKAPALEQDKEISLLREKLGETTMENELLRKKIALMESGRPLARRRSRR